MLAAVGGGDPVLEQRVADLLEFDEVALPLRSRLSRTQVLDGRRHGGQHPGVHGIGLGAPAEGTGKGPDLEGVDRVEGESGLQEGILERVPESRTKVWGASVAVGRDAAYQHQFIQCGTSAPPGSTARVGINGRDVRMRGRH